MKNNIDLEYFENVSSVYALRTLIDSISDIGIFIVDMNDLIIFYNTAASFYDRIDRKTIIGKHYKVIYKDSDGGIIQVVKREKKPVLNRLAQYQDADGRDMSTIDSAYPIYIDGEIKYILVFTRYNNEPMQESLKKVFDIHSSSQRKSNIKRASNSANFNFSHILGDSHLMMEAKEKASRAAGSMASVFLEGETGTGKELFAQSIHTAGNRKDKPFVAVNCAAIPENLLESTLFGTTKGSFTGAENKPGLFEQAADGTFFLDEINSMPLFLQAKLLRVIQERKVRRVGAVNEIDIHCRIIASCNKKAELCIQDGDLRNDLYFRLSVIKIEIPPLRNRKEDIKVCIESFIKRYAELYSIKPAPGYTSEFFDALFKYDWPGNVRELEHIIESAIVMLPESRSLTISDLPSHFISDNSQEVSVDVKKEEQNNIEDGNITYLKNYLSEQERVLLTNLLIDNNWNITNTAKALGMSRSNLQYRIRKYNIKKPE